MIGIYFHGRRAVRPSVLTHVDAEEMVRSEFGVTGAVALIGEARGGEPGIVHSLLNPVSGRTIFKDGDLLTGIEIVYDPAKNTDLFPGASRVLGIRVNPATQASGSMQDVGSVDQINLTSIGWGVDENQIRYKVEPGTVDAKFEGVNGEKVTFHDTIEDIYEIADNMGPMLKVQYMGDASTALLTLTGGFLNITLAGDQTDGSEDLSIDITKTSFDTVLEIANYINTFNPFYEAYVLGPGMNNFPADDLDQVIAPGIDCKTAPYVITALIHSVVYFINENSQLLTAEKTVAVVNPLKEVAYTFLTGGSEGVTTNTEWQNALDELTKEDVSILVPITTDESRQHLGLSHVNFMTAREKKRTMVVGHDISLESDLETLKNRARAFNSSRVVLASPGILRYNRQGVLTEYSSVFTGCCYAGMAISSIVTEPLTYDYINAVGLTTRYTEEQIEELLLAGISPVEFVEGKGYRIVQSITTYLQSDNPLYREWSMQRLADEISINVARELEDSYIGKGGTNARIRRIKDTVKNLLKRFADPEEELIIAWKEPVVTFSNQWVKISYEVSPVEPINWITITTHFKPARIEA